MAATRRPGATGAWRSWLAAEAARAGERVALSTLASVLAARRAGSASLDAADLVGAGLPAALPPGMEAADLIAAARPWLLADDDRRARGAVYTPPAVAAGLLAVAVEGWAPPARPVVCDPACGGGAFLLAAARWLHAAGHAPAEVVGELLRGADTDPVAVEVAAAALAEWAAAAGAPGAVARHLVVADALAGDDPTWAATASVDAVDLVVGNPPFLGQLAAGTARRRDEANRLAERWGAAAGGYVDSAALFLALGVALVRPGGRVALIVPESVLGARDAAGVRAEVLVRADLVGLWVAGAPVFDAATKVCAPVLERRAPPVGPAVRRWRGPDFAALPPGRAAPSATGRPWSPLVLAAYGTPEVDLPGSGPTVGDLASATAGFRRQFYGLAPHVVEADDGGGSSGPPRGALVTSGAVDPARLRWGHAPIRFAGRRWQRPVVDLPGLAAVDPELAGWVADRLVPKVLVATQTRVVEAVADPDGVLVPSVPVVSVEPTDAEDVWRLLAVLLAPTTSAWALARTGGTALAADAVKLPAAEVRRIPLPPRRRPWDDAAELLRPGGPPPDWVAFGSAMLRAYRLAEDDPVLGWWTARLAASVDRR